jgi:hypothetical protein
VFVESSAFISRLADSPFSRSVLELAFLDFFGVEGCEVGWRVNRYDRGVNMIISRVVCSWD